MTNPYRAFTFVPVFPDNFFSHTNGRDCGGFPPPAPDVTPRAGRPASRRSHRRASPAPQAKRPRAHEVSGTPGAHLVTLRVQWRACHTGTLVRALVRRTPQGDGSLVRAIVAAMRFVAPASGVLATEATVRAMVAGTAGGDDVVAAAECAAKRTTGAPRTADETARLIAIVRAATAVVGGDDERRAVDAARRALGDADARLWDGRWVLTALSRLVPDLLFVVVNEAAAGRAEYHRGGVRCCCGDGGVPFADSLAALPPAKAAVFLLCSTGDRGQPHYDAACVGDMWVPHRGFVPVASLDPARLPLPTGAPLLTFARSVPDAADQLPFELDRSVDPGHLSVAVQPAPAPPSGLGTAVSVRGLLGHHHRPRSPGVSFRGELLACRESGGHAVFAVTDRAHRAVTTLVGGDWGALPACAVPEVLGLLLGQHPTDAEQLLLDSLGPVDFYRIPELRRSFASDGKVTPWLARAIITRTPWVLGPGILAAALRVLPASVALVVDARTGQTRAVCGGCERGHPGGPTAVHPRSVFCFIERGAEDGGEPELALVVGAAATSTDVAVPARNGNGNGWRFGQLVLRRDCVAVREAGPQRPAAVAGYSTLPGAAAVTERERAAQITAALGAGGGAAPPDVVAHCVAETTRLLRLA